MAGVTNVAFRTLCRELELARAGTVSGLYVCEMVTARALVERHPATMHMVTFAAGRDAAIAAAVLRRPGEHVRRGEDDRRRGPGRPHRHELRLPGSQGHPARRRCGTAVQTHAVRPDRRGRSARHRGHRHPRHGEVPDRNRRCPPHPPRRGPDRRRGGRGRRRAARPHRRPALLRRGRLGADRALKQHVTARTCAGQRRHLRSRRRAGDDGRDRLRRGGHRPGLPGPAVAVRRAVGGLHRNARPPPRRRWARSRRSSCATANCSPPISARTRACATSASTSPGTCTASPPAPSCDGHWRWSRR